jgi:hypothetical protein
VYDLIDREDATTGKRVYDVIAEQLVVRAIDGDVEAARLIFEMLAAYDPVIDSAWESQDSD